MHNNENYQGFSKVKKLLLVALFVASSSILLNGQATSTAKLGWDQGATTLLEATSYTYKYYADGSAVGTALTGVTCTGSVSPFQCQVPFPAFTPGNHTIQITATNVAGESDKSSPLDFVFVVNPSSPTNLRIIR